MASLLLRSIENIRNKMILLEKLRYAYYMNLHNYQLKKIDAARFSEDFKSAYSYIGKALKSGLRAEEAYRKMGEETVHLRAALESLKRARGHCLGLLNEKDLGEVASEQPHIRDVNKRFGSTKS